MSDGLLLALPKGRIARELAPVLSRAGIEPEAAFADEARAPASLRHVRSGGSG